MPEAPSLPIPYYLCVIAVGYYAWIAWKRREEAWGIPMIVVLATAGSWYLLDPLMNEYSLYVGVFGDELMSTAWWEVLLFFISLGILCPIIHRKMNAKLEVQQSQVLRMMRDKAIDLDQFQDKITSICNLLLPVWLILMVIALIRTEWDIKGLFFPYLGNHAEPWGRDRLGGGLDALLSLAGYLQILLTSLFGVVLALSKRPKTILLAATVCWLAFPAILFDRTRNTMLAVLLPGLMALVTLRMRGSFILRVVVIVIAFLSIDSWFKFVIAHRTDTSVAESFKNRQSEVDTHEPKKHNGFNMFEELGFINYFISNGTYRPNWGARYFSEIVNPIPRALWPGKPMIGIDYAVARGFGDTAAVRSSRSGGVVASVSTGMIGQGVVNFGRFLGPIAAALIMAIWVAILARQDLMGGDIGHILLYAVGLVLTYNLGRDVTLLVLYPFLFGVLLLKYFRKKTQYR